MPVIFIFSVLFLTVWKKAFHLSPDPLRYGLSGHFGPQQALGGSPAYGCNHFSDWIGSLCADRGHNPPDIIFWVLWHHALLARFPPDGRPSQPPSQLFSAQYPWGTFVLGLFSFPLVQVIESEPSVKHHFSAEPRKFLTLAGGEAQWLQYLLSMTEALSQIPNTGEKIQIDMSGPHFLLLLDLSTSHFHSASSFWNLNGCITSEPWVKPRLGSLPQIASFLSQFHCH